MPDTTKLAAEKREEFGKGAARRLRRADKIPAVIYGHGIDPIHISLPGHESLLALRTDNAVLTIDIAGGESQMALAKQVTRDPIKGFIEHVDLVVVRRGEKVTVDVAITVTGEAADETVVVTDNSTVSLEVEATNIPEVIEVSIEGMEAGSQILAKDLELPQGASLAGDEEMLIVNVTQAVSEEQLEAELAEAEAEAGIEREESDEEKAEAEEAAEGEGDSTEGDAEANGDDAEGDKE